ncbi:putative deoxycytidylate deaminase [Gorgonomyces haynaldii]|nr:putative deoxycytidylate deaminase [Gorgonomyces haynaldii]
MSDSCPIFFAEMIIFVTGQPKAGKHTLCHYLDKLGFTLMEFNDLDHLTQHWDKNHYTLQQPHPSYLKRPFVLSVFVDAPALIRFKRSESKEIMEFLEHDILKPPVHLVIDNPFQTIQEFHVSLELLDITTMERLRPSWDQYFIHMCDLASSRSNCMKRRVGAVITLDNRVIATGYNGTPRGILNCNQGGCQRCNDNSKMGSNLDLCLCIHAEENALLEAGRERCKETTLYCNTMPVS